MADPGFPREGGANSYGGGANLLFGQKFPEICMKMKEFGPRGGARVPGAPLRSANDQEHLSQELLKVLLQYETVIFLIFGTLEVYLVIVNVGHSNIFSEKYPCFN